MPVIDINGLIDNRVNALRKAHQDSGINRAELDLSGGIDSAVMAGLLIMALGPENVTLVHSRFATSHAQSDRARRLAEGLGCPLVDAGLGGVWEVLLGEMKDSLKRAGYDMSEIEARIEADPTILGSIRSCLRAPIGRGFNRLTGVGLRHGTGNECEDRWLRFYQKGGDGEVDSNPIAMLSKGEVYQLAWGLMKRLPAAADALRDTILAIPSPDLWGTGDGHSDEAELLSWTGVPFTYSRIDVETGEYSHVGLIERVSRFLDTVTKPVGKDSQGNLLFSCEMFDDDADQDDLYNIIAEATYAGPLRDLPFHLAGDILMAARKAERITRHKMNPNCPTYGTRQELVRQGILTDQLPEL